MAKFISYQKLRDWLIQSTVFEFNKYLLKFLKLNILVKGNTAFIEVLSSVSSHQEAHKYL